MLTLCLFKDSLSPLTGKLEEENQYSPKMSSSNKESSQDPIGFDPFNK